MSVTIENLDEISLEENFVEGTNNPDEQGNTLDGNTQIVIEPRVSYTLSRIVRASAFVRYKGTMTEGASNPGYSTFQVGLDIRISIAGGR